MSEFDHVATADDVFKLAAQRTGFTPFGRERILDDATNAARLSPAQTASTG
jgi:hypothetical protein